VTGTEREATLYGGSDLSLQRAEKGTEHLLDKQKLSLMSVNLVNCREISLRQSAAKPERGRSETIIGGTNLVHGIVRSA
jgi:hypothetical protein